MKVKYWVIKHVAFKELHVTKITWLMWYVHDNKQKKYCLGAKKFMDNDIFSGNGENTVHLWLLQYFFCVLM